MSSEFPVEQLVQLGSTRFQEGFARQAIREVEQRRLVSDQVTFAASTNGLVMLAESEEALEQPLQALRELYRDRLQISPPRVRYVSRNRQCYEPIMLLRVQVADSDLPAVHDDLTHRNVTILDEDFSRGECVLRAEAPLRKLLGFARTLASLTRGTGLHRSWLDRYAPTLEPHGPEPA